MITDSHLTSIPQWLPVLLVPKTNGKTDKLPCDYRTGSPADQTNPQFWTTHAQALACAAAWGPAYTIGLVLTTADDLFCVDIDGAMQADGNWSPLANELAAALPGCFIEVSQSGQGLHIWGRYPSPPVHKKKNIPLHIECYTEARFIAIGKPLQGAVAPRCDAFPAVIERWFKPNEVSTSAVPDDGPRADWRGPTDDDDLLRRAMKSKSAGSAFGERATFADLFLADADALARAYPADNNSSEPFDRSSADAALASHLAFWTGCDVARIERLMRRSKLVREKWDNREDYLVARTIMGACARQTQVLQDKPPAGPAMPPPAPPQPPVQTPPGVPTPPPVAAAAIEYMGVTMTAVPGSTFMSPEQQAALFQGCFYISEQHRVLMPGGRLVKPDVFKAHHGGYTFAMDARNERTSRNAFEAFTESQVLRAPRVDNVCFKPQLPYGAVLNVGGRRLVNTYEPAVVVRTPGPAAPFFAHLAKLIPDEYERNVVWYTMCCLVQHLGYKAQWAIVLQGAEGNGKTFLARCLAYAIGKQYVYWPRAEKITKDFNAWLLGHCLYVVEEIMVGDKQDLLEVLKPLITAVEGIEIERKGIDQSTAEICGNFWFNTNYKNGVLKRRNDRRFCCIQTAQQSAADLVRDGMGGDYMRELHLWADRGGYAEIAHALATTEIPAEFDFTKKMQRAPITRSTELAIADSLGVVEQEILDAIEADEVGFRGGWISSGYLDKLLVRLGKDRFLPINKRRDMLESMGYVWQPQLTLGRVNNTVLPDGAKVKLFVRADRPDLQALGAAEAARAYSVAQGVAAR